MNEQAIVPIGTINEQYQGMVGRLFKKTGMHHEHDALIHAAIGLCGEIGEVVRAVGNGDRINLREEFGDWEFYAEAVAQSIGASNDEIVAKRDFLSHLPFLRRTHLEGVQVAASDLLDIAKKLWVYGHSLSEKREDLITQLATFYIYLDDLEQEYQMDAEEIMEHNMQKLEKSENARYKDGQYSDAAAQARADKQGESLAERV